MTILGGLAGCGGSAGLADELAMTRGRRPGGARPGNPNTIVAAQMGLGEGASFNGCPLFPADSPWNRDISQWPVDPLSAQVMQNVLAAGLHMDFGAGKYNNNVPFGIPYVITDSNVPGVPVLFQYADESDPAPYPIPADAPVEASGDKHVIVVDRQSNKLYELFGAVKQPDGSWTAGSGAKWDLTSSAPRTMYWTSADAAGLPILPGLVRADEVVEQGEIKHALRFTMRYTRRAFVYPATHWASDSVHPARPPMGIRVRLRADYDISRFGPQAQVILRAMKKYGMILADNGGNMYVSGAPDSRWDDEQLISLHQVKGSDFEVVEMGTVISTYNADLTDFGAPYQTNP